MKTIKILDNTVCNVVAGCMRIGGMDDKVAEKFVGTCIDNNINFFDHADIYGGGVCETVFGKVLKNNKGLRDKVIIQTKCGIVPGDRFDFSYEHIIASVNGSLQRLGVECVDYLLLHRPDALVEPNEVARAFDELKASGKVKNFGVSNHNPYQIELLKKSVNVPILINQLQFSVARTGMVDCGLNVNMTNTASVMHDGYVLDYCRLNDIAIQAWSPFQYGWFEGTFIGNPKFAKLNEVMDKIGAKYGVTSTAIAISFILRHPAKWQVVVGTTSIDRIIQVAKASDILLTREEWYEIYRAAGNLLP